MLMLIIAKLMKFSHATSSAPLSTRVEILTASQRKNEGLQPAVIPLHFRNSPGVKEKVARMLPVIAGTQKSAPPLQSRSISPEKKNEENGPNSRKPQHSRATNTFLCPHNRNSISSLELVSCSSTYAEKKKPTKSA